MTDEQAVSMKEPGKKLGNLKELLPNSSSNLIQFGQYMATRLNQDDIVPMGFVLGCELALYDLQSGVDGFTGQTIQNSLVGYPPMIYAMLRMEMGRIAEAVFPAEFATAVKEHIEAVRAEMHATK